MKLVIKGELSSLNEMIKESKEGRGVYQPYAITKKILTGIVALECKNQLKGFKANKIYLDIVWFSKDSKKDPDNVSAGIKFILDGLVKAGVIPNDTRKHVKGFSHAFDIDKLNPRVEVFINNLGEQL